METILVVNAGSSSLKFQVFGIVNGSPDQIIKGQIDGIGVRPRMRVGINGLTTIDQVYDVSVIPDQGAAMQVAGDWLREARNIAPSAVGHRVVHGGAQFDRPVRVDQKVLDELTRLQPLAPLHQPHNLSPIRSLLARFPNMPQVACFDTAFHRSHDPLADHYAIPLDYYEKGLRRYGFHGLSYEFIAEKLSEVDAALADKRVIVAHLGSGASMCALRNRRSVESTMGFTALDGLPMGTRPGQLDPGVVLHLILEQNMRPDEVQKLLYSECGLKGLSGVSNDVRDLESSADPRAWFALDYFAYRIGMNVGALAAVLGGLDAFVFTAGIGENSPAMRSRICERLGWLGASVDPHANARSDIVISSKDSRIKVMVIPTNEELMIARHTLRLLSASG